VTAAADSLGCVNVDGVDTVATSVRDLEQQLVVLLTRARHASQQQARRIHPELQTAGYAVLLRLSRRGRVRAADLVAALDLDKGVVSRKVAHLERLGLVERTADPADGRAQLIALTDAGRAAVEHLHEEGREEHRRRLADWTPEEITGFVAHLQHYNASLDR
jgi:DNA-binding MarR family transcriptional regulator